MWPGRRWLSRDALLAGALATALSLVGIALAFAPLHDWTRYPLLYTDAHDALFNLFFAKTVMETGWYASNPALGAPFGATFFDFPKPETLFLLGYRAAGLFTRNGALVYNLFYFLGFPLVALAALAVLRRELRLSWPASIAGGLLFSWLPYHYARIEHLFLSNYLAVPLAVGLVLRVCGEHPPFFESGRLRAAAPGVWLLIALTGSAGLYYAYFAVLLICGSGLVTALARRAWRPAASAVLVTLTLGAVVTVNLAPSLLYWAREGANPSVAARSLADTDVYALRPLQLFLPYENHRLMAMATPARAFVASLVPTHAERKGALGVFGATGCLLLLLHLLTGNRVLAPTPAMATLARANALAILVGMAGGFGALVSLLISPVFRALDRISVYIAFVALATFVAVLDRGVRRLAGPHHWPTVAVFAAVIGVGFLDQTPADARPDSRAAFQVFTSDRLFVSRIERELPSGAMVYQLPYASFPEARTLLREPFYSSLRPYLQSTSLRWSYGGMRGRCADRWHRLIDGMPLPERIAAVEAAGFRGIVVDRLALRHRGRDCERVLRDLGLPEPESSPDGSLAFYRLPTLAQPRSRDGPPDCRSKARGLPALGLEPRLCRF